MAKRKASTITSAEFAEFAAKHYSKFEAMGLSALDAAAQVVSRADELEIEAAILRLLRNDMSTRMGDPDAPFNRREHAHGLQEFSGPVCV